MSLTTQEKINVANISSFLVSNELKSGKIIGGLLNRNHPHLIFAVRQGLEWLYGFDSTHEDLEIIGNYLISICRWQLKAQRILNVGSTGEVTTTIAGTSDSGLFPIVITDEDMTDGTIYDNPLIVGKNIMLWVSRFSQEWEIAPDFFIYTSTGFQIVFPDFDAANYRFIRIDKFNSSASAFSPSITIPPIVVEYDLSADDTLIANLTDITTAGQPVIIDIKANGFTYNWDTMFEFSDTYPEQPTAITDGFHQIYSFSYIPSLTKLTIVSESLNVEI